MLKGKNLYYVLGLGAVAYYFFWMNKKKKAMSAPSTAPANFTGDLGVPEYQNGVGVYSDDELARINRIRQNNPNRASRVASRIRGRNMS
jgi:hypothetical protein